MQEFYIKDPVRNIAFRGVRPTSEINCLPLDYCKYPHAELMYKNYNEILKQTCPISIPEHLVRKFVLEKVEEKIAVMLASTPLKPEIQTLFSEDKLSSKDQERLLKGMVLTPVDILWINKCAQDLGYLI